MYISKEGEFYFSNISYDDTVNDDMTTLKSMYNSVSLMNCKKGQGHFSLSGAINSFRD